MYESILIQSMSPYPLNNAIDQIEMLIDFFEKQSKPITEFDESAFDSIVEKIVVINQQELEFHMIGELKFKEKI